MTCAQRSLHAVLQCLVCSINSLTYTLRRIFDLSLMSSVDMGCALCIRIGVKLFLCISINVIIGVIVKRRCVIQITDNYLLQGKSKIDKERASNLRL